MIKKGVAKLLILLLLVGLLPSSCSIRSMYGQLSWLIPWYLNDYLALTKSQSVYLNTQLIDIVAWHKTTQLPDYVFSLRIMGVYLENGLERSELDYLMSSLQQFSSKLMEQVMPDIIVLLSTSSDAQIDKLLKKINEGNIKFKKKYLDISLEKQQTIRYQEMEKQIKQWIGSLTKQQSALVVQWSQKVFPYDLGDWDYRITMLSKFVSILPYRSNVEEFTNKFAALIAFSEELRTEKTIQKRDTNRELNYQLLLDLDKSLTSQQRRDLLKKIDNLANDLEKISRDT